MKRLKIFLPIKHLSRVAEQMAHMQKDAFCSLTSRDEIGILADHINYLYQSLLSTIESLETEKQRVSDSEKLKVLG